MFIRVVPQGSDFTSLAFIKYIDEKREIKLFYKDYDQIINMNCYVK